MIIKQLTPTLSVSDQVMGHDLLVLSEAGFRSVICNRPDSESADQASFAEIEAAAKAAGIEVAYLPIVAGTFSDASVLAFGTLIDTLPKPILAYCRTGNRSATLWSLSESGRARRSPGMNSAI